MGTATHGEDAIINALKNKPDLILLDIMLPDIDGVEVCQRLRESQTLDGTVIAFLTARGENYSQIAAFEAGADDYMVKPVNVRVLLIRIKALLKRKLNFDYTNIEEAGKLEIDKERMIAIKNSKIIDWQNKEFQLLDLLSSRPGKVFSREEIFKKVWANENVNNERIIDVYVRKIREKIGNEHIVTIIGKGYKFVE